MRILHTSDWHLGKTLEGHSRLGEQELFLEELLEIVEREEIDMLLVAGDIYDTPNPPAMAERLFYKYIKKLSNNGERAIIIIAGNHDSPERLTAASPLAYEQGIILLGTPKGVAQRGESGAFKVMDAGEGYVKLQIKGQEVVAIALSYPSEKRLNEILSLSDEDREVQKSYSKRVEEIFQDLSKEFKEDTINLALSHLYMVGGEQSDSERQIQLGGSLAVESSALPPAQYIALGHLHRPQRVKSGLNARYSGSPIQYSKSEINYSKSVYKVEVDPGEEAICEPIYLRNYKPIEVWRCKNFQEALDRCKENAQKESWIYLEIETSKVLTRDELKALRDEKKDIVEIRPILLGEREEEEELEDISQLNLMDLFQSFYQNERNVMPSNETVDMFSQIVGEEGEEDQTIEA